MLNKDKDLFHFLSNAPKEFREGEQIKKYQMKNGDFIHCVLWNMHFYLTGTDIVKILLYRFQTSGRQLSNLKKFEEGIFSDLRNLKPGIDATLEGPRSEFLEFLYKNGCIRTQKKQKVFYWYSVPHDALFCDAMERDMRRETQMISYNKYVTNPGRLTSPLNFNSARLNSHGNEIRNLSYSQIDQMRPPSQYNSRPDPMGIFDSSYSNTNYIQDNMRRPPSAPVKVYPEFDSFDPDAFYKDESTSGLIEDLFSSNQRQIAPSDISRSNSRKNHTLENLDFLKERIKNRDKDRDRDSKKRMKKSRPKKEDEDADIEFYKRF